jgi:hypothetical protein
MAQPPLDTGNAALKGPLNPLKGKGKGAKRPDPAPAGFPAITNARDAEHWLRVFEHERSEFLAAFHDLQQRFTEDEKTPLATLVRRRAGGLLWRKRSVRPAAQTLFEPGS